MSKNKVPWLFRIMDSAGNLVGCVYIRESTLNELEASNVAWKKAEDWGVFRGYGFVQATLPGLQDCQGKTLAIDPPSPYALTATSLFCITAKHSGKCLDVMDQSLESEAPIIQYDWWGGGNQRWEFKHVADNYYQIFAQHSGMYLTGYNKSMDEESSPVIQLRRPVDGRYYSNAHLWKIEPAPEDAGYVIITNKKNGQCLDVTDQITENSARIVMFRFWGGDNQKWKITKVD